MQAARNGAQRVVHLEEAAHFVDDVIEVAGFVTVGRRDRVPVHGIGDPEDLCAGRRDLFDDGGELLPDVPGAHPGDEGQAARFAVRIQLVDEPQGIVARSGGPQLDSDRVADPGQEVHVGVVQFAGAFADPEEMRRRVVRKPRT
ncbi:hypothetical protein D9M72_552500 [compost metagenome]